MTVLDRNGLIVRRVAQVIVGSVVTILLLGQVYDYYFQAQKLSGLDLPIGRWDLDLVYYDEWSSVLGGSGYTHGYRLPNDFNGLGYCGGNGFSELKLVNDKGNGAGPIPACTKMEFMLSDTHLIVKSTGF